MEPLHPALRRGAGVVVGARGAGSGLRIAVLDFGVKRNTLRSLASRGAEVVVLPHSASLQEIDELKPDGVVLTNGPGDPASLAPQVALTREVLAKYPILAICLGHQLVGRAVGGSTSRLPFGHHGGNHPVVDMVSGEVFVTPQNHEFQVDAASIDPESGWFISERNLNDDSVEGLRHRKLPVISVQYHPEGSPGPQDRQHLFDEFLGLCRNPTPRASASAGLPGTVDQQIRKVVVLGSGPIVIGQAAEFDYAGTQACRALREEGMQVVLVNSNPATIMTDEEVADRVYLEPLTVEVLTKVIEIERPDGLLAGVGRADGPQPGGRPGRGRCAGAVRGAGPGHAAAGDPDAEDRERFKRADGGDWRAGSPLADGQRRLPRPARSPRRSACRWWCVLPSPSVGPGAALSRPRKSWSRVVARGTRRRALSPRCWWSRPWSAGGRSSTRSCGTADDTCICVCNMENLDPMGVHTGDSMVVAPSQTLTDSEHQQLRSAALRIISALEDRGRMQRPVRAGPRFLHVLRDRGESKGVAAPRRSPPRRPGTRSPESRPRSPSGRRLGEIRNPVTGRTCAAFEPSLDYCVAKSRAGRSTSSPRRPAPRHADEVDRRGDGHRENLRVGDQQGAALAGAGGAGACGAATSGGSAEEPTDLRARRRCWRRCARGQDPSRVCSAHRLSRSGSATGWPTWPTWSETWAGSAVARSRCALLRWPSVPASPTAGSRDAHRAWHRPGRGETPSCGVLPTFKCVDTCAAEFDATTPYFYSSYEVEDEQRGSAPGQRWCWGRGRSGSGRGSSSITARCRRRRRSGGEGWKR